MIFANDATVAPPAPPMDWAAAKAQILVGLDVAAEFESLGVVFARENAKSNGVRECHAAGREDESPSAFVNVKTGVYHDSGGGGLTLGLFDFALKYGGFGRWIDVVTHYAARAGVELGRVPAGKGGRVKEAEYLYRDADGVPRYRVARYRLPNGKKAFAQAGSDGRGGFRYGEGAMDGVEPLPYRLPELLAGAATGDPAWVVEGEKDADRLASLGLCATTNSQGAGSSSLWAGFAGYLEGRDVLVLPDNDPGGRAHAAKVAAYLRPVARSLKVVELPGLPPKGDVSDWLDMGHDLDELGRIASLAPEWSATPGPGPAPGAPGPADPPAAAAPAPEDERFHRTDLGNARRMVAACGDNLHYCHPWGKWLVWAGDRWQLDETGEVFRLAREVVAQIHAEAAQAADEAVRKALVVWAMTSETERRLNSMVSMARHQEGIPILPGEMDSSPWLLNCPNGTVDLRTGRLRPHSRADGLLKRTSAPYRPDAACPTWDAFLTRAMGDDEDLVGFLRRSAGYAITADVREHALFFLYGHGRNGKSTFLGTLQHVLGDYAITINADVLTAKHQEEHPTGVADLQGRRLVATIEVEDGRRLAESLVKTLTGGDRIRARRMRQDFYEFDPTHKIFLAANHKPTVRGTDEGIWRRIKLVPFRVSIPDAEVDRTLPEKLRAESPGILAWLVRGCLEWQRGGLREPEAVRAATAEYRAEMDTLADFFEERCLVDDNVRSKASTLYRAYVDWCKDTGNFQASANKFGRLLSDRGFGTEKSNSTVWRTGVGLKDLEGPGDGESVPF